MRIAHTKSKSSAGLIAAACAATLAATGATARAQSYTPISLTGWNQDLVAETTATGSTSTSFDLPNKYVFYQAGLPTSSGGGLPVGGSFVSASNANTTFQFQPYTANNALFFNKNTGYAQNSTGTLTLGTPNAYKNLAFLSAASNGAGTIAYTLNFSDGGTQTGSFVANDWFNNTPYAIAGIGRASRGTTTVTPTTDYTSNNPRMYETDVAVTDTSALTNIQVTGFTSTNAAAIFAVSGVAVITQLTYTGATNGNFDTATANFNNGAGNVAFANGNAVTFDDTGTNTAVTVQAAGVLPYALTFNNNSKAYSFAGGSIGGGGAVQLNGSGTVTFNGSETYTGPTNVSNGTLVVGPTGAILGSTSLTVGNSGTLTVQAGGQLSATTALTDNGTVNFTNSTVTVGALAGSGTVNVTGTALTVGAGTNFTGTFAGTGTNSLNVTGGTITFASPSSLAVFAAGLTAGSTNSGAGSILFNDNSGQLGLTGTGAPITITGTGGTVGVPINATATYAGNVVAAGTATTTISTSNSGTLTLTGSISGPAPVAITSAGGGSNLTLAGTSTGTGPVTITGGTNVNTDTFYINLKTPTALSGQAGLVLGPGAGFVQVDLAGNNESVAYLSSGGSAEQLVTSSTGSPTLTITGGNGSVPTATFGSVLTGGLSLVKAGAGNQILSGRNTYGGTTAVNAGTLTVANPQALSTGTVNLGGGTLALGTGGGGNLAGFAGFALNNGATVTAGNVLTLTDGGGGEARSAFSGVPANFTATSNFTASFLYTSALPPGATFQADGITFTIQNDPRGNSALGDAGGSLGYGGGAAIANSAAVQFNIYTFGGGVGFGTNGVVNDSNSAGASVYTTFDDPLQVTVSYNGSQQMLTETIHDNTYGGTSTFNYSANLPALLGGNTGYVGFTAGTGGGASIQNVSNFTFNNGNLIGPLAIANPIVATANTSSVITTAVTTAFNQLAISSLTLNTGSKVSLQATAVTPGTKLVATINSANLSISGTPTAPTSQLDIVNNDLVVTNGSLANLTAYAAAGYGRGSFNGSGIVSSAALANPARNTTVGVILNSDPTTGQLYGSGQPLGLFDGANPGPGDVLVKYTYFGDANLDGVVNGADYARIDAGFLAKGALTGWYNGDFNYDGKVDASDYTLIDNAFNTQTGSLKSAAAPGGSGITAGSTDEIAPVAGSAAVPEPASLGLLAVAAGGLLARRRRI